MLELTRFGNVDIRKSVPEGYQHMKEKRLQPLCRKLGIEFAEPLVDIKKFGFMYRAIKKGVVVRVEDVEMLKKAIQERESRALTYDQKQKIKERKFRKKVRDLTEHILWYYPSCPPNEAEAIAEHTCEPCSGRVGRSGTLDIDDIIIRAVKSHIRHNHTQYHELLEQDSDSEFAREYARSQVRSDIDEILRKWEEDPNKN